MAQNIRAGMIGRNDSPISRTQPQPPTRGEIKFDRERASRIIAQLNEQGVAPESAAAIAAAQLDQSPGGVTVYDPYRSGAFGNYQMRFDSMSSLRSFAERLGGDVNDLSSLLSFRENEYMTAERAGYEFTSGSPGAAVESLGSLHSEFGQHLLNRPNQRAAQLADQIYAEFYDPQRQQPQDAEVVEEPTMRPQMRPDMQQAEPELPVIERPGDSAPETQQNPVGLFNQDGDFVAFNSMSRTERRMALSDPRNRQFLAERAAPPVREDVDLSATRATGEPRSNSDITLPTGGNTQEGRRAQGFLDRMFNRGDNDPEAARVRRRNFFRIFSESLNYLTRGGANMGPVYAAAERAEQQLAEGQQREVLAEMATNMGMGELVGLMELGDAGVSAVRNAVIGAVTSGVRTGGGGGSAGTAAPPSAEAITPQERDAIQMFEVQTGGDGSVSSSIVTSDTAPQQPAIGQAQATPVAQPSGGYQTADSMVEFAQFSPRVGTAQTPAPATQQDNRQEFKQAQVGDVATTPELGFSGRTFEGMPGQMPGPNVPVNPTRFGLTITDGTTQENVVARLTRVNQQMENGEIRMDPVLYRQNDAAISRAIQEADAERREEIQRLEERALEEEAENERQNRMSKIVSEAFFRSPATRAAAQALAASGTEDAETELLRIVQEEGQFDPRMRGPLDTQTAFDTAMTQFSEGATARQDILGVANTQLEILADPNISLNRLRTNVAIPFVDWVAPIADSLDINLDTLASADERAGAQLAYAQTILSVAPQSSELPGAISNTEFLAFQEPARVADQPRLTGLLTNQAMRRSAEREMLLPKLRRQYLMETPYMQQTPEGMEQFVAQEMTKFPVVRDMDVSELLRIRDGGLEGMSDQERAEVIRVRYPSGVDPETGAILFETQLTTIQQFDDIREDFLGVAE
jgi:hypothetical protein